MTGPSPLIHIGLHKTATTWLQDGLFGDPEAGLCSPWSRDRILEWFVLVNPLRFDADRVRAEVAEGLRQGGSGKLVPVLSHERLSGNPHSGGYDRMVIADRLASLFPEARVLIVIREQRAMIASTYKQYVREGGASSLRRYLRPPVQGIARIPLFSFDYFEYDTLVECYARRFGAERVLVLPYEMLRTDELGFVSKIVRFAGGRVPDEIAREKKNVGLSALSAACKRWLNLVLVRDRVNPNGLIEDPRFNTGLNRVFEGFDRLLPRSVFRAAEQRLQRLVAQHTGAHYRKSNERTSGLIDVDLARFGYDVGYDA